MHFVVDYQDLSLSYHTLDVNCLKYTPFCNLIWRSMALVMEELDHGNCGVMSYLAEVAPGDWLHCFCSQTGFH
jgi:hypothetical protein